MHHNMSGFSATSNGLASGNDLLEAISHGLCEVVERDAMTLWHLLDAETRARTRIDLDTVSDPTCRSVLDKYARAQVGVSVWEITSDVGIPAFLCRVLDLTDNPVRQLGYSECMGCHPVREIALLRALTEAAQSRLTVISGSRDDCYPIYYEQQHDAELIARRRVELYAPGPWRHFHDGPAWQADTFNADVAWELERLHAAGLERAIMVNLTKAELGLSVVRVVVPGLEALAENSSYVPGARVQAQEKAREQLPLRMEQAA
jgi:ribosomal protein S12 methylthiotransferase accessory factor